MKIKSEAVKKAEQALDKEIEQVLGRAVDGNDLQMFYEMDLKMLNQMNKGSQGKFDRYIKQVVRSLMHNI